jgi:phosphoribosylaminoimidazole-succinocarboxamide synthase
MKTQIKTLELIAQGKVRDIYNIDDGHILIVTSDRVSAFDAVLPTTIPNKGKVLTTISNFWFEKTKNIIPNHLTGIPLSEILPPDEVELVEGRAVVVKKLTPLPIECIVRGYIIGSGWDEYLATGAVCGIKLPEGLLLAEKLPEAIYTPTTKASIGEHDEAITYEETIKFLGLHIAEQVRYTSLQIYNLAVAHAADRDVIIADTKLEFGLDKYGNVYLIDEVLTPDSSRFWAAQVYEVGKSPQSFDKQYIRDYLKTVCFDKNNPPELPEHVVNETKEKYIEAQTLLMMK